MGVDEHRQRVEEERAAAHSGGLARFVGACAAHPWRVVATWLTAVLLLIVLNAAFHGKLINEFKIPGTDFQKATDLINAKFGGQKGAALRVVVAAPEGQRLDSAAGTAAIEKMLRRRRCHKDRSTPQGHRRTITDPLAASPTSSPRTAGSRSSTSSSTRPGFELPRSGIVDSRTRSARSAPGRHRRWSSPARPRALPPSRARARSSA